MTVLAEPLEAEERSLERRVEVTQAVREQWSVAAGQVAAGVGNLAFVLVLARVLRPHQFAESTAWLALFLLINLPAASLGAGAALDPPKAAALGRRSAWAGAALGLALALLSPTLAPVVGLPAGLLVVLAAAAPLAGPLAVARGRLYGRDHRILVASLLIEPAVRLVLGSVLAVLAGTAGGVAGVLLAGGAALVVARAGSRAGEARKLRNRPGATGHPTGVTVAVFLLLAVIQNQDLVFANALLHGAQAGAFAALSTLGGVAALATITVPLVLLPRAAAHRGDALAVAIATAGVLGGGATAVVAVGGRWVAGLLFGSRYASIAHLAVPYVGAMALFGVCRVVIADRCARGRGAGMAGLLVAVAGGQAAMILAVGTDPARIAASTLAACGALAVGLLVLSRPPLADAEPAAVPLHVVPSAVPTVAPSVVPSVVRSVDPSPGRAAHPRLATAVLLTALCGIGLGLRLAVPRGLWLDEATSVLEAKLTYTGLLHALRTADVHPPLYFSLLWATVRAAGSGELVVRLPSILAGVAVIPAAYVTGRDLYDHHTGRVAAALAAGAPLLVWYSQEARMYSFFMLFSVLAVWGQVRAIRYGDRKDWALYTAFSALLVWNEYFGILQVVAQQVGFAWVAWLCRAARDRREYLLAWIASAGALVAVLAPLAPFAYHQFVVNQRAGRGFGQVPSQAGNGASTAGSRGLSIYTLGANLIWALWGYHADSTIALIAALWPFAMLAGLVLLGRRRNELTTVVLVSVILPTVALFGIGLLKPDLFDVRYISGVVVLLVVLTARGVTALSRTVGMAVIATVLLFAINGLALADQQLNGANPRRYDFRSAFAMIRADGRPGDVVLYDPGYLNPVLGYYAPGMTASAVPGPVPILETGHRVFVLATPRLFKSKQDYAALGNVLAGLERQRVQATEAHWPNVELWEFR